MSNYNLNASYGRMFGNTDTGKVFVLALATEPNFGQLSQMFIPDADGTVRLYSTWATAIAATAAGRGDKILVSQGFVTAPTQAEIATMLTNGVVSEQLGGKQGSAFVTHRAPATLPATTKTPYFTVTGKVRILEIVGEVTTAVQAQANAIKLVATGTVGAAVDLCATVESNAAALGSIFTITGTLASAMVKTVSSAGVAQAAPLVVAAGTIDLNTAATNTGATKWTVRWEPIDPGARVIAA